MLTYQLEERGHLPLYEFLYQCIRQDILAGNLKKDEKLPSKRSLAKHLNISIITIESAYAQLQIEGYIYSREKSGYFVSDIQEIRTIHPINAPVLKESKFSSCQAPPEYFADFQTNSISEDSFPFSVWSRLTREVLSDKDPELLKSQPSNGAYCLRKAICEFLYHFRGMAVTPEQVFIGAGTEYLYSLLVQLLGRHRIYAVEDPGYRKVAEILTSNGAACKYIPLDLDGLSCSALAESGASIVHISPAHHFPTGIVMPITRRQELLSWACQEQGRYIIEDDYDSEFRFQGRPIPTMQSIGGRNGQVIYINTFSKSLTPSIRISYMVLPQTLVQKFEQELNFYSCTVSSFEQYVLAAFISRGCYEQHINRTRNAYRAKRNCLITALRQSSLAPISKIQEENSGLHFLLEIQTAMSDEEMIQTAAKNGIKINCLSKYYHNQAARREHVFILNYSGVSENCIDEAICRLASIFA